MTTQFKIVLVIFAFTLYLVGYIAWRVQNDALKRGYSGITATFWALGVFFFAPVMFPLYVLLREKSGTEIVTNKVEEAKRKLYITCPYCGEENPPELSKCQKCERSMLGEGHSLGTRACPYCGTQNEMSSAHCSNCRQSI